MSNLLIDLNFVKEELSIEKWVPFNGDYIFYDGVPSFDIVYDKVPLNVSFKNPSTLGSTEAENTLWNGISCPNPKYGELRFDGMDAGHTVSVSVDPSDKYHVEFWFKPNTMLRDKMQKQGVIRLFRLEEDIKDDYKRDDGDELIWLSRKMKIYEKMVIYVEDEVLKCAPHGLNEGNNTYTTIVYKGINPLRVG